MIVLVQFSNWGTRKRQNWISIINLCETSSWWLLPSLSTIFRSKLINAFKILPYVSFQSVINNLVFSFKTSNITNQHYFFQRISPVRNMRFQWTCELSVLRLPNSEARLWIATNLRLRHLLPHSMRCECD